MSHGMTSAAAIRPRPNLVSAALTLTGHYALQRFRRTALGSAWIIITTGMWITAFYFFGSGLLGRFDSAYLPYIASGICIWGFLSGVVVAGAATFTRHSAQINSLHLPLLTYACVSVGINLVVLAHLAVIFIPINIAMSGLGLAGLLQFVAAVALYGVAGTALAVVFGVIGARFRDFTPFLEGVMRMAFVMTPIFWEAERLQAYRWIVDWNPFFHAVEIGRAALIGAPTPWTSWAVMAGLTAVLVAAAAALYPVARRRVLYWL